MTEAEARKLEIGDRVVFDYEGWHPPVCGTVKGLRPQEFMVRWDDGQLGEVPYNGADKHIRRTSKL